MVDSMLRQVGYKTGLFTSPHLVDVRERIRINGCVAHPSVAPSVCMYMQGWRGRGQRGVGVGGGGAGPTVETYLGQCSAHGMTPWLVEYLVEPSCYIAQLLYCGHHENDDVWLMTCVYVCVCAT